MAGDVAGLVGELQALEGIMGQNPETGAKHSGSFLSAYTNRLFGAPFQLMDSVDRRFGSVNPYLGNEFLRNFMLNSPILHVRPGLPKYTGAIDPTGAKESLKRIYEDVAIGGGTAVQSMLNNGAASLIFGDDSNIKRRMFGFRETYYDYMQHVNYMCHTIADLLDLASGGGGRFPNSVFTNSGPQNLSSVTWENYRMLGGGPVPTPTQMLSSLATQNGPVKFVENMVMSIGSGAEAAGAIFGGLVSGQEISVMSELQNMVSGWGDQWGSNTATSIGQQFANKISTVQFLVEPVQFEENLTNTTGQSMLAAAIDGLNTVGSEIQWMTNSNIDAGLIDDALKMLDSAGNSVIDVAQQMAGKSGIGGFVGELFHGALGSLKGQKMLYPEIYKSSETEMNYNFTVNLVSPYGDIYNYYINIVVPLLHLIALASPRMVTANSVSSPFLVQCYVPGMCGCQLGIVSNMTISKNPDGKHVSVNGFPLTVKVTFTVKELYKNLSISPGNDPASFLFNETLNDYMCTLAGLLPSLETSATMHQTSMESMRGYFNVEDRFNDIAELGLQSVQDWFLSYYG